MPEFTNNRQIQHMLLQESIWGIEDKVNIMIEDLAKHECQLLKLKHSLEWIMRKLGFSNNGSPPQEQTQK